MLVVSTYVEKSDIEGLGLFTAKDINEGDIVWFLDPTVDTIIPDDRFDGVLNLLPKEDSENFKKWAYRRNHNESGTVDYVLCCDNTKFANHSDTPNLGGGHKQYDIALRDIKAGEELTYDYRIFDGDANLKLNQGNSYDKGREETGEAIGETQS